MERLKELGFIDISDEFYTKYSKHFITKNTSVNYSVIVSKYNKEDNFNLFIVDNDTEYEVILIKDCIYNQVYSLVSTLEFINKPISINTNNLFIFNKALNDNTVDSFHNNMALGYYALSKNNHINLNHIKMTGFNSDICMICNTDHSINSKCVVCGNNYKNPNNDSDTCYDCREPLFK